jgi:3-hydroxyisobutyrate dehydrogenase-like beta-hydroxyacid dehydrogenase
LTTIGIAHPGAMGAAVAAALRQAGHTVLWASADRSDATRARAAAAGAEDAGSLVQLAARSEIVISICPPHASLEIAVALAGFSGTYIDANATSPATALEIAAALGAAGARYIDGSIIGPPPVSAGTTRLYLSGEGAGEVARAIAAPLLETIVLDGAPTAASAIKMAHAGWTKGSAALLLSSRAAARALGVDEALVAEWQRSQPGLVEQSERAARTTAANAWRWSGEMEEVAATFASTGVPDGFHLAAAAVFRQVAADLGPGDLELLVRLLETLTRLSSAPPARDD